MVPSTSPPKIHPPAAITGEYVVFAGEERQSIAAVRRKRNVPSRVSPGREHDVPDHERRRLVADPEALFPDVVELAPLVDLECPDAVAELALALVDRDVTLEDHPQRRRVRRLADEAGPLPE